MGGYIIHGDMLFTVTELTVGNVPLEMELDTGALATIISEATYRKAWSHHDPPWLQISSVNLRTYAGEKLELLGSIKMPVKYKEQDRELPLLVVKGNGPSLLGRD